MDLDAIKTKTELALQSIAELSADELAEYFKIQGIKMEQVGKTRSFGCPLAQYLQQQTGYPNIQVTAGYARIRGYDQNSFQITEDVRHGHADFVNMFDNTYCE